MSINSLNIIDTDKISKTVSIYNIIPYVMDCRMIEGEEETDIKCCLWFQGIYSYIKRFHVSVKPKGSVLVIF